MDEYETVQEDVTTLAGFLEQVDRFSAMYQELIEAGNRVDDEERLAEYQEAVRDELRVLGNEGIKQSYPEAQQAYRRLERYAEQIQDSLYAGEHDWLQEQKIGDPVDFYGDLNELLTSFEEIDTDAFLGPGAGEPMQ